MRCTICRHGETAPGTATVTLTRGGTTLVVRDVPAEVCVTCGEDYLSEAASRRVLAVAKAAVRRDVEVEVLRFAA